ncbi:D-amino acid dehydrogenase [Halorhodospira abdelmalekii]|uniref:D-amino acid dehydrogenase n=1 Tax=Halorhodospira abdelmalekii TaxID=421629 RepID=UPI001907F022|nr:D-amino acid dehydrogenase [Halorhodospira abdelmalekii]
MRIVVVGAGVIGATVTWELTERGHHVILVERAEAPARETSYANGGQLHAGHAAPWNAPGVLWDAVRWLGRSDSPLRIRPERLITAPRWLLRFLLHSTRARHRRHARANALLAEYGVRRLYDILEHTGIDCQQRRDGILKLFDDQAALQRGIAAAAAVADLDIEYRVLDRAQTLEREPALQQHERPALAGAIEFPADGCGDARRFALAITERAVAQGAELRPATPVIRLRKTAKRIAGVVTEHGLIDGDAVILAAGSYSAALAHPLGLRLPIEPIKGYSVTLPLDHVESAAEWVPQRPIIDDVRKIVLTRLGDRLRIAGKAEIAGFDKRIHPERCRAVRDQGLARFPKLAAALADTPPETWSGLRPMTHYGSPLIGPTPISGLHLATGVGHLGWTFAASVAQLVADQLEGLEPTLDPRPYHLK